VDALDQQNGMWHRSIRNPGAIYGADDLFLPELWSRYGGRVHGPNQRYTVKLIKRN